MRDEFDVAEMLLAINADDALSLTQRCVLTAAVLRTEATTRQVTVSQRVLALDAGVAVATVERVLVAEPGRAYFTAERVGRRLILQWKRRHDVRVLHEVALLRDAKGVAEVVPMLLAVLCRLDPSTLCASLRRLQESEVLVLVHDGGRPDCPSIYRVNARRAAMW